MDGRLRSTKEMGTGKLQIIDELRSQLSHIEKDEGSSLSLFRREKLKRESKLRMIDDDVLKSYDMVQEVPSSQREAISSERRELQRKRSLLAEKQAAQKAQLTQDQIESFLREKRVKDIKPQHLERYRDQELVQLAKKSEGRFNLKFYENNSLKRLTRMFTKVSYMKLAEIDPANIDFHSMQNLDDAQLFGGAA